MGLLHIDKGRLDEELTRLPQDIHDHSVRLANAKATVEAISNELELEEAKLSAAVRNSPKDFGLGDKATVDAIKGAVLSDDGIQAIGDRLRSAKNAVDLTWAVVNGLAAKREAIQPLVKLFLSGYYAHPQPSDVEEAKEASAVATQPAVADKPKPRQHKKTKPIDDPGEGPEPSTGDW